MENGTHRTCTKCKKIFLAEYFPFKSVNLCVDCWEEEHHRALPTFREKLKYYNNYTPKQNRNVKSHDHKEYKNDKHSSANDENILSEKILQYLKNNPGEKAKTIASNLGVDRKKVNSLLYGKLKGKCVAENYYWEIIWKLKKKNKYNFTREFTIETIEAYIENRKANNKPIVFYYRNDSFPRIIHEYFLDGKYIQVVTDEGQSKTFLLEKIRKLE